MLRRILLLLGGCILLGSGVGLVLRADLGSDGFSTLVSGLTVATGLPFFVASLIISVLFVIMAAARKVMPGIGTVVQIFLVGGTANVMLELLQTPASWPARVGLLLAALPVLAVGIAAYLGAQLGAGPMEAAGLAWDPPLPFRWSYNAMQLVAAVIGWLLGGTIGLATIAIIVVLGPLVDLTARLLGLDVHQDDAPPSEQAPSLR
ncbi:MAG: hypothetical protein Q4G67_14385 [Actinomycetia bacterium]|nr:hypothetical protein [Actinomycetes bacterium]